VHTQVIMATQAGLATAHSRGLDAAVHEVPRLLGMPGEPVTVVFRGRCCTVIADQQPQRPQGYRKPITEIINLELISGHGEETDWSPPVRLHAIIETGRDALRTVHRASRWASYAARVAVIPEERLTEQACLEASLRGIWVIATGRSSRVAVTGQRGLTTGAARGLLHRLLYEVVAEALAAGDTAVNDAEPVRSAFEPS
jgi:hypothetical protein